MQDAGPGAWWGDSAGRERPPDPCARLREAPTGCRETGGSAPFTQTRSAKQSFSVRFQWAGAQTGWLTHAPWGCILTFCN